MRSANTSRAKDGPLPLLSICIPTYKRARQVRAAAEAALEHYTGHEGFPVEIVVVNNKSPDDTAAALATIKHPALRVINRTEHFDTAEENIMRSLPHLRGEYVWFLGDDDVISVAAIPRLIELLQSRRYDCIIFNSPTISPSGKLDLIQPIHMNAPQIEAPIDQIVESIGLLYTFAGISNIIQRREQLSEAAGIGWLKISKIYSHVAWFVEAHAGSVTLFVNAPLVFYRQNDYSDGHWGRVAAKFGVPDFYFWTLGIVRLIRNLADRKVLSYGQASNIFELGGAGNRYRLLDDVVFKMFQQIEKWAGGDDERQGLSAADVAEWGDFCIKCDPSLYDIVTAMADGHEAVAKGRQEGGATAALDQLRATFMRLFDERQSAGQFINRFVGRIYGFDAFRMVTSYVAIRTGDLALRERVLRQIDPLPDGRNVLVASTIEEIAALAIELGAPGPVGAPPASQDNIAVLEAMAQQSAAATAANTALIRELVAQNAAVYGSTSWAITAPIRAVGKFLKRRDK